MERVVDPMAPVATTSRVGSQTIAFALMLMAFVIAPFLAYPVFLMKALCFALFACAFNLLIGYGGLLSFGHALFFGWASYVAAHMAKVGAIRLPWFTIALPPLTPELAILFGTAVAALLGFVAGALAIRRQGIYFAMITLTYGFGVGLAALAGVLAAPIYNVSPQMGSDLIVVVFAVVVIGGMGSIMGAVLTGFGLGIIEGLTKVFWPEASNTVIFVIMAIVLLIRPAGLFGRTV